MKKAFYLLALIAIPALASAQDTDKEKEAAKPKLVTECMDGFKDQATTEELKAAFKDFCTCQVDGLLKEFSLKEVEELKNMETADQAKQQEIAAKVMPIIMPCMEELQKKMGAGQ